MINRNKVCLNGYWDFCPADGMLKQIPEEWEEIQIVVPSPWNINSFSKPYSMKQGNEEVFVRGGTFDLFPNYPKEWESADSGWYKRDFFIPEDWMGQNITLLFQAVHYYSEFYINDVLVHSDKDGFLPIEFSINSYVKYGENNSLVVGVRKMNQFLTKLPDGSRKYEIPTGSFWGDTMVGIWQDVYLMSYPESYISDLYVTTDLNTSTITIETEVTGKESEYQLSYQLSEWKGSSCFQLTAGITTTNSKSLFHYDYSHIKQEIKLWWPDSPNLYHLEAQLSYQGEVIDTKTIRFGFRSFEVKGNKFYLNHIPYNLRNDSWHYMGLPYQKEEYARLWYKMAKEANANHVRLHAQVYPEFFLDIADEMGMLITDETAIWGSHCRFHYSMKFIENGKKHVERMIKRDRNHPSVIMWNVDNECVMAYMVSADNAVKDEAELNERLYLLAEHAEKFDSTRPICADGCRDYGGRLSVVNVHYPGKHRNADTQKPIAIGEMGSMYYSTPDMVTNYYGERVYHSFEARLEAVGWDAFEALREQRKWAAQVCVFNLVWYGLEPLPIHERMCDYDDMNTPGVKPQKIGPYISTLNAGYDSELPEYIPNPVFHWTKAAYQPERFFFEGKHVRYYNGELGENVVSVFNDSINERDYTIEWTVMHQGRTIFNQKVKLTIAPSEYKTLPIAYELPYAKEIESCSLRMQMLLQQEEQKVIIFEETIENKVYNQDYMLKRCPGLSRTAVLGTIDSRLKDVLEKHGVTVLNQSESEKKSDFPEYDYELLIVNDVVENLNVKAKYMIDMVPEKSGFEDFIQHQNIEKAFLTDQAELLGKELDDDDLYGFRKGYLADRMFTGNIHKNVRALMTTGNGLPLILESDDKENQIHSCLPLLNQCTTEPAAAIILGNLINYIRSTKPVSYEECVVISKENSKLVKFLVGLKALIRVVDCEDYKSIQCLRGVKTILVDGSYPVGYLGQLMCYHTEQLMLWNLQPQHVPVFLQGYLKLHKNPLNQLKKVSNSYPITRGIHSSDLYGLEKGNETIISDYPIYICDTDKMKGILKNSDINWRVWNHQGEQIKTAAILRSSKEIKPEVYGLAVSELNGVPIIFCQINISAQNQKLKKLAIQMLTNLGVRLNKNTENEFDRMITEGIYEEKLTKALVLYEKDQPEIATLRPGFNHWEGKNQFWQVKELDRYVPSKAGTYLYAIYLYSPSDRRDLLLNPDLVSMKIVSENEKQVYLCNKKDSKDSYELSREM
ncbi:MAG: beta-galactosidase, partial [Herbinix sp.]|nr:beta-galactosidase [Herbinix sp.]